VGRFSVSLERVRLLESQRTPASCKGSGMRLLRMQRSQAGAYWQQPKGTTGQDSNKTKEMGSVHRIARLTLTQGPDSRPAYTWRSSCRGLSLSWNSEGRKQVGRFLAFAGSG